ncbi:MAG: DNA-directed RNA polymerase subunit alpha [Bacteroidales bacterium]
MPIIPFQKPDKVVLIETDDYKGKFEFKPLEPGYGITIGNAIRRILLSSLEGFAITNIKIDGIYHEFSTIKGVIEDVTEIILQLKQVRFKQQIKDFDGEKVTVTVSGQNVFKAGDIGKFLTGFKILNPDFEICHMEPDVTLKMDITVSKGRGYVLPEENVPEEEEIGVIPVGSVFTPIRNVQFTIENMRIEQKTDFEKLILEVATDGSVSPKEALKEAAKILIQHFMLFSDEKFIFDENESMENEEFDEELLHMRQLLKTKLIDLDLSVRALNCLKAADIETLGDLVQYNKTDLLKFRNFGKKSLSELEKLLADLNLEFGIDTVKYKLDKE